MAVPAVKAAVHCAGIAVLALAASLSALGQGRARQTLYFLSGTPVFGRTYPAELYRASNGQPLQVREVAPGNPQAHQTDDTGTILVADDLAGQIVVVYPGPHDLRLAVVHEDRPQAADLRTNLPKGASNPFLVHLPAGPSLLSEDIVGYRKWVVTIIPLSTGERRNQPGAMQSFAGFRSPGTGDPFLGPQGGIPSAIRPNGIFMPYEVDDDPVGHPSASVRLTKSSPPGIAPDEDGYRILVASDKFFVIERPEPSSNPVQGHWYGEKWRPTEVYSLNRRSGKWRSFALQTPSADYQTLSRIFGDWLITTIALYPRLDDTGNRAWEEDVERDDDDCTPGRFQPIMPDPYYDMFRAVSDSYTLPGELQFTNLEDGRNFIFRTGHGDSEVIAIANASETVIYRINNTIYSARIEGKKLSAPTLIMKGCDVQNIHWAFWSLH